jgi:hypothetical protein
MTDRVPTGEEPNDGHREDGETNLEKSQRKATEKMETNLEKSQR